MNIYLIRSEELSKDKFRTIVELIKNFNGPAKFIEQKEDVKETNVDKKLTREELRTLSWDEMFSVCKDFRKKHRFDLQVKEEDAVVLLTEHLNEYNWFSSWQPDNKRNFFIQTSMWEYFSNWENYSLSDSSYPIVYELIAIPYYLQFYASNDELVKASHREPQVWGCILDMCENKSDVLRKLHSGDVCPQCRKMIEDSGADPFFMRQFFTTIGMVREQILKKSRQKYYSEPPTMHINIRQRKLYFPSLGNFSIHLSPKELTIYLFFLNHPEVTSLDALENYGDEIYKLYRTISNSPEIAKIRNTAMSISDNNNTRSTISKLKDEKFLKYLDPVSADFYILYGDATKGIPYKIKIDRQLVTIVMV